MKVTTYGLGGAELLQLPRKNNKRSVRNIWGILLDEKQKS